MKIRGCLAFMRTSFDLHWPIIKRGVLRIAINQFIAIYATTNVLRCKIIPSAVKLEHLLTVDTAVMGYTAEVREKFRGRYVPALFLCIVHTVFSLLGADMESRLQRSIMTQTRIDQFYKVINVNRNRGNAERNRDKSSNSRNREFSKKRSKKLLSRKSVLAVTQNCRTNLNETSGWEQATQSSGSSSTKKSHSLRSAATNSPVKAREAEAVISLTNKQISPIRSQELTVTSHSGSKYIPKIPSPKRTLDKSRKYATAIRRRLFRDKTEDLMFKAIENLNLAKEEAITSNDINLEKVYSSGMFDYKFNSINTMVAMKYEINEVVVPTDMYSRHFFLAITTVFSNLINCKYFDEDELDLVYSLLTLPKDAQELFVRMLKRKQTWHRVDSIKYTDISDDLTPLFNELVSRSIFKSNMEEEDISVLLNLMQVHEVRELCQKLKIKCVKNKTCYVQSIVKFCHTTKSLLPGIQSPAAKLRASANKILGYCIILNTRVKVIVDRIITLLMPNRDPTETIADVFLMLLRVDTNEIKFPDVPISDFPIFASKEHLLNYVEAKNALSDVLSAIERREWQIVRNLGLLAMQHLSLFLKKETQNLKNSALPGHVRHFMPGYVWLKILSKSVDAFKKTKETLPQAIEFLRLLLDQNCHMKNKKGQWYVDLMKTESHYRKNFDISAALLSEAVSRGNLTEVDKLDLLDRAEMLAKRKSDISQHAKNVIKLILNNELSRARLTSEVNSITVQGTLCKNILQRKSTWCISDGIDKVYGTVESLALYRYKNMGYPRGVHCEGAFPILLFGTLFWHEIYNIDIPAAYVSLYQDAPLDLFSSEFYENRKERIDTKLQVIRQFDSKTLSEHLGKEFDLYCGFKSICQNNLFDDSSTFQEVALCLGTKAIVGICERLIHNYVLWKAGFPDLIVWNANTKQCKIVEVKGPGDSLSTKQKLWLQYLSQLGLNVEVCYCESDIKGGRKRKHEAVT